MTVFIRLHHNHCFTNHLECVTVTPSWSQTCSSVCSKDRNECYRITKLRKRQLHATKNENTTIICTCLDVTNFFHARLKSICQRFFFIYRVDYVQRRCFWHIYRLRNCRVLSRTGILFFSFFRGDWPPQWTVGKPFVIPHKWAKRKAMMTRYALGTL